MMILLFTAIWMSKNRFIDNFDSPFSLRRREYLLYWGLGDCSNRVVNLGFRFERRGGGGLKRIGLHLTNFGYLHCILFDSFRWGVLPPKFPSFRLLVYLIPDIYSVRYMLVS